MSLASKNKELPKLPMVLENDKLEDINLSESARLNSKVGDSKNRKYQGPYINNLYSKENLNALSSRTSLNTNNVTYYPSPLKNQILVNRSSSTSSHGSNKSNHSLSEGGISSQFIVRVDKTPSNLTPSQRLKFRKLQLNDSISKFKGPIGESVSLSYNDESDDDEEIDNSVCVFNVPLSQPLHSIAQKEKFVFGNSDRKSSLTTDSTRTSSILSHESLNDTASLTSNEADESFDSSKLNDFYGSNSNNSLLSIDFNSLKLSKDAHELTLLFNQSEYIQIDEESRQRRKLLADFKKISNSVPSSPLDGSFSDLTNIKPSPLRSVSSPSVHRTNNIKSYGPQKRAISNPSLPISYSSMNSKSKSKNSPSKYYTFTRPTWLPPKSSYDKVKHQKESDDLIYQAILKESREQSGKLRQLEKTKKLKQKDASKWENSILPNGSDRTDKEYKEKINTKEVKEMYWRGIPEGLRARVWWKQIGNSLKLDEKFCDYYFCKFDNLFMKKIQEIEAILSKNPNSALSLQQHTKHSNSDNNIRSNIEGPKINSNGKIEEYVKSNPEIISIKLLYDQITNDLLDTYPDLNYFQNYEIISKLIKIIVSFIIYLNESENNIKMNEKNLGNLHNYYFTGLNNLAALLYYNYKNSYKSFVSLCNIFNRQLPSLLLGYKIESGNKENDNDKNALIIDSLNDYFINKFENLFKINNDRLFIHFTVIQLRSLEYVPDILLGLFSNLFNFELSCHLIDIYIFENDSFLMKCLLGLFKQISYKLYGTKQETISILGERCRNVLNNNLQSSKHHLYKYLNVGYEYEFMECVKGIEI